MLERKEMRADLETVRAIVENDEDIIALKSPGVWLAACVAVAAVLGTAYACLLAVAL